MVGYDVDIFCQRKWFQFFLNKIKSKEYGSSKKVIGFNKKIYKNIAN